MQKTVKKVRVNFKALIVLLLIVYLIGTLLYTFFTVRIKNIYINNTRLLTDNEIIEAAGIKDYPMLIKTSSRKLEEKIGSLELVANVEVNKDIFTGKITIDVEEAIPLFYNRNTNKIMLSNGKEVLNNNKYMGIPTLINYVPNDLLEEFRDTFKKINPDIIGMINEIEYDPDIIEDIVIDNKRFKLRMNDGNMVYINTLNMKRLDNYIKIYAKIASDAQNKKGTLYLDSYLTENNLFITFDNKSVGI